MDGTWTPFGGWGLCSQSCGRGIQKRTRFCVPPKNGGVDCVGSSEETRVCHLNLCPGNAVYINLQIGKEYFYFFNTLVRQNFPARK